MFLIRQSKPKDVATLLKLARMVYFINLPPDERIIADKIAHSQKCFTRAAGEEGAVRRRELREGGGKRHSTGGYASTDQDSDLFMFTIEEVETGAVIGTSQMRARMGGPGNPNYTFQLSEKTFKSKTLGRGTTHTVAKLYGDESGPTEIGGLILQLSHRGHKARPGRFLAFIRFHFMGLYRELFADRVLAEMMATVSSDGDNVFWDAIGRHFIPVKYAEADRFCQHNRQFIDDLFPKEEIYLTLLPLEVQNMVGAVSRETIPARRLLESLGFNYRGFIDPFDGGPHLDAQTDEIPLVKNTAWTHAGKAIGYDKCNAYGMVSVLHDDGEFRATEGPYHDDGKGTIRVPQDAMEVMGLSAGQEIGATPLDPPPGIEVGRGRRSTDAAKPNKVPAKAPVKPAPKSAARKPARRAARADSSAKRA